MNRFNYPYDLNINLTDIQIDLAEQVIKKDLTEKPENIAGVDVSFAENNTAVAAAVLLDLKTLNIVEKSTRKVELDFPYIPGYLGFRESGAMVSVLKQLKTSPDMIMVNGHGILHPRGFGLASQVGLLMDKPTIGLAKRLTMGKYKIKDIKSLEGKQKSFKLIKNGKEIVGAYIERYYVSIGHKISLNEAIKQAKAVSIYKTPEPIRQAHILATEAFKDYIKKKIDFENN